MGEARRRKDQDGETETVRRLASRTQFLQTHLMVLNGPGPFTKKYLTMLVDAVESQRSTNPEVEALRAEVLSRVIRVPVADEDAR